MASFHYQKEFNFGIMLAKKAGSMIRTAFYKAKNVDNKLGIADLVTETDQNVEKYIIKSIKETFPDHEFIGEETVAASNGAKLEQTNKPTWVVDPVDGTTNFVHRFPHTCVAIGFMDEKITQFGIVFNPIRNELYSGRLGFGSTLQKIGYPEKDIPDLEPEILKINQSSPNTIKSSLIITEFGNSTDKTKMDFVFENMTNVHAAGCHGLRSMGSAALNMCFVAAGRADAYYEAGMHIWDICAAGLILREAGGVTVGLNGEDLDLFGRKIIAATNSGLAQHIAKVTTDIELSRD